MEPRFSMSGNETGAKFAERCASASLMFTEAERAALALAEDATRLADARRARRALLADPSVDALAEQVGVPVVAGVLLDHVHQQFAQRDRLPLGVAADVAEIVVARELLSEGDLLAPRRPRLGDHGRVSGRTVEVSVGIGVGLVTLGDIMPGEPAAEPAAFHLGHVPDKAEQGHRGRFDGPAGQLPGVEPVALQLQRQPLAAQEIGQRRLLVTQPRAASARVGCGIEEQVRPMLGGSHADRDYCTARAAEGAMPPGPRRIIAA